MAIYTKRGDKGKTSLYEEGSTQKKRIDKDSLIVEALGSVDELNSYLGICKVNAENPKTKVLLGNVQENLLKIGTIIAGSKLFFSKKETSNLEKQIDEIEGRLPVLKNFVVPGGSRLSAHMQYARALARRAERRVVALSKEQKINGTVLTFLNRLSDYLFMLARDAAHQSGFGDEPWVGRRSK